MKPKKHFKLMVKKILKEEQGINMSGQPVKILHTVWEEVDECNIGSIKEPNKSIIEFAFVPIEERR